MNRFARLYAELDASTSTLDKVDALVRYFAEVDPADAAWAVYFLAGGKPRRVVPTAMLRALATQRAAIADWLFDECYQAAGDLAETIALVLPPAARRSEVGLAAWVTERLLPLRGAPADEVAARVTAYWDELDSAGRFLLVKLIGGGLRVGVGRLLVQRALAQHAGIDAKLVAQRMMGTIDGDARPDAQAFARLVAHGAGAPHEAGQPYPFFLAHALDAAASGLDDRLGPCAHWLAEWKYDGIRAQLVRRAGRTWLWSRGEELIGERFPEIVALADVLADGTVLDGEIVVWKDDRPAPFQLLQKRIGRGTVTKGLLAEAPASFVAFDLLELRGLDQRGEPQHARRSALERLLAPTGLRPAPLVEGRDWAALAQQRAGARQRGVEGLMLKHRHTRYGTGRTKADGAWWKWKLDPFTVDAVLVYAQAGHGRRAGVYTDYTFAVWSRAPAGAGQAQGVVDAIARREPAQPGALQLVPFAKAYSGLGDDEFERVDRVIRATTVEKFGPVRSVRPTLVFEIGFEGINRSARHRCGLAVRFPRMLRIRDDKPLHEADTLAALQALLAPTDAESQPEDQP